MGMPLTSARSPGPTRRQPPAGVQLQFSPSGSVQLEFSQAAGIQSQSIDSK
jgi:hypothetical protein